MSGYLVFGCFAGTYGRCCRSVMLGVLDQEEGTLNKAKFELGSIGRLRDNISVCRKVRNPWH